MENVTRTIKFSILVISLSVISCSKIAEISVENMENQSMNTASGKAIFNALFLLEGKLTNSIPSLKPYKEEIDELIRNKPKIQLERSNFSKEIDSIINANNPNYFNQFKIRLASKNLYAVKQTLIEGAAVFEKAALSSSKYGNFFKVTTAMVKNPKTMKKINQILNDDAQFKKFKIATSAYNTTQNENKKTASLTSPNKGNFENQTNIPKLEMSNETRAAITKMTLLAQEQVEGELIPCTPATAVCVYYLIAGFVEYVGGVHTLIGAFNMVGYVTILVKTKVYVWSETDDDISADIYNNTLSAEMSNLLSSN